MNDTGPISLRGQVAVVTGGGKGIGRAHCLELAGLGASVVVNDLDRAAADVVVAEIAAEGGAAVGSHDTVATPEGGRAIVDAAVGAFGTVDAVVNNAGFMRNGFFEDQTPEMLDAMLDVHVRGAFFVTQAAWPIMRAKGHGRVILTSSGGGMFAMQGEANYAAAKSGVYGLGKALAYEGHPLGIKVNVVLPGGRTTITADDPVPGMRETYKPGMREALGERRLPKAVAPFVAYLASPACAVNGEAFVAIGGVYARVFVGVALGWVAPDAMTVTADDIAEHLDQIRDQDGYTVPENNYEQTEFLARSIGWQPA